MKRSREFKQRVMGDSVHKQNIHTRNDIPEKHYEKKAVCSVLQIYGTIRTQSRASLITAYLYAGRETGTIRGTSRIAHPLTWLQHKSRPELKPRSSSILNS